MEKQYKKYTDLEVWTEARKLVATVYSATKTFPRDEQFGLISQMRRCSVSIPSNIAEGCGRNHKKDSLQFFFVARGSIYELETQLYLSCDLHYLSEAELNAILTPLETNWKLLNGFIRYYQNSILTTLNPQPTA